MPAVAGRQVLVVGQLLANNEHASAKDDCGNTKLDSNACSR